MHAHKVCDWLTEKCRRTIVNKGPERNVILLEVIRQYVLMADKFKFESIPFEVRSDPQGDNHLLIKSPILEAVEKSWFEENLIPLPSPYVWYEFNFPISEKESMVVGILGTYYEDKKKWHTHVFTNIKGDMAMLPSSYNYEVKDGNIQVTVNDYPHITDNLPADYLEDATKLGTMISKNILYLTLIINSRSTTIETIDAPAKVNKKRESKKQTPIHVYRKVIIISREILKNLNGGTGTPKKIHTVISHNRHYKTETKNSKWSATMMHEGRAGWWIVIVPRHIKGRRELGTVEHDYIVR